MGVKLSIAVIATFALTISGLVSQIQPQTQSFTAFDCGTITGLQAQGSQLFNDFGHGFQFEFPANWHGSNISLSDLHTGTTITIDPRFAIHDPRFYIPQAARAVGTKAVNGLEWTVLAGPGWGPSYYTYRGGVAVEIVTQTTSPIEKSPSPGVVAALNQVLSSFTFVDEPSRMDHQISALSPGHKLGGLNVKKIIFNDATREIEFTGSLTLTGTVSLESTMGGSSSGYFITNLDDSSRSQIPQLNCPFEYPNKSWLLRVSFANQEFAERQFGKRNYYEGDATVLVDRIDEVFGNSGTQPSITATLVEVLDKPSQ